MTQSTQHIADLLGVEPEQVEFVGESMTQAVREGRYREELWVYLEDLRAELEAAFNRLAPLPHPEMAGVSVVDANWDDDDPRSIAWDTRNDLAFGRQVALDHLINEVEAYLTHCKETV